MTSNAHNPEKARLAVAVLATGFIAWIPAGCTLFHVQVLPNGLYGPPDSLAPDYQGKPVVVESPQRTDPPEKANWTAEEITGAIVAIGTLGGIAHRHWFHRKSKGKG